jgi:ATP-dependent helicase/nuclease subunit A
MAEKKIKWTVQQAIAVTTHDHDVLVAASAGTGKTSVLSGSCVNLVSDKSRCPDVCSMLVLTFTNAAADQMRSRIAEQLNDEFLKTGDPHLRYQSILLPAADISTIHSFCKRLITEYFYLLELDPTFRVIESDEQTLLKAEVLEKTIDWAWQQPNLAQALQLLLSGRSLQPNDGFLSNIIELSDFLNSVILRDKWYDRSLALAGAVNPFSTEPGTKQKQIIAKKLKDILIQIQYAQQLYKNENTGGKWAAKWQENFVDYIVKYIGLLKNNNWDEFAKEIASFPKPLKKPEYKPRDVDGPVAEVISNTARAAREAFEKLSDLAVLNPDYLDKISFSAGIQTKLLIELVKQFDRLYSQTKLAINCLDFADLEHYALKLLTEKTEDSDTLSPSKTALALRRKYRYIFVDEYQDINPVQQEILNALGSDSNVFVVGDVKQSIYAFRGAEPRIFIERLRPASTDMTTSPKSLRVDLNANFRSAKGILDFVNKIFGRIMTASFANIDYDRSAQLIPADERIIGDCGPIVELNILDETPAKPDAQDCESQESDDDSEVRPVSSRRHQAAMIARQIRQMTGADTGKAQFQIYDKKLGKKRDVEYRDITILMRSPAKRVNDYVEVLRLAGIPVSCQDWTGYFEQTEIRDCVSLLKILDNPQRDIELASVLRSGFFNITDTELAKVKLHSKNDNANFYQCLLEYSKSGHDIELTEKLKAALELIEQWRTLARRDSLADVIWQIFRQTSLLSFVCAMPNGTERRANLLMLHDRAIQFENFAGSSGTASLTRFIQFIEKLEQSGRDWTSAEPETSAVNAVQIMSVHKSKGLEFPVVFLAELDSRFNKTDSVNDCLIDSDDTLGLRIVDRGLNSKLSTLAHQVIAERKAEINLAEEMRILYVATTRAKERLILTACEKSKHCQYLISNGLLSGTSPIADWQLRSCNNLFDWILYGLCDQKILHETFKTGLADKASDNNLFNLKLYSQSELDQFSKYIDDLKNQKSKARNKKSKIKNQKLKSKKSVGTESFSQVKKLLTWQYDFADNCYLRAKESVTQLTHYNDEYVKFDYTGLLERKPKAILPAGILSSDTAKLIGTATHLLIASLDLTKPVNKQVIQHTIEKLLSYGAITDDIAEHINIDSILTFFQSPIGRLALKHSGNIEQEWPFSFALPASNVRDSRLVTGDSSHAERTAQGEFIIIQGIIDMLIKTPIGLVVVDFKTDRITAAQTKERAELYREQLNLYSLAASEILKSQTIGKWLYFLTPACQFELK